jgi:acyl-CoA thioester hydrolase
MSRIIERTLPIRTYDIDFAGIVSNIVYIRWLEDLRLAMMEEAYPIARALAEDVAPILLETKIAYERPVTIHDALKGRMWATEMGRVK